MQYMRKVPSSGEPIDLIDLKFLPAWVKEDWSATRHAGFEGVEERAHWSPEGMERRPRPPRHRRAEEEKTRPPGHRRAGSGALVRRVPGVTTRRITVGVIEENETSASRSIANVPAIFRRDAKRWLPPCCRSSTSIFFRKQPPLKTSPPRLKPAPRRILFMRWRVCFCRNRSAITSG